LYKVVAKSSSLISAELSEKTGIAERSVREWLAAQAASGYVQYNPDQNNFYMTPE